ncbi:C2H2 type zinc-finger-domain-containing protein [Sphaerosporella brunnea]|uniref:C2H2 type zinc-finger-domain-containing protein n=1 Tax=Sphaerosporella brunnea TaxID=1250544 RepID=A0A5J5F9U1_9PEZI|nr:C2H2 type zinc-finger-domain-containing protein [Sphaerosporella brunnea]
MASVLSPPPQKQTKSSLAATHPFTCNTCLVAFRAHEAQRSHYHTDWHQYNLKRKVADLAPLSSEVFAEKILQKQADTQLERERATFEKHCAPCNKTYYSENGYINHVGSHKHRQNVATAQMNAIRAGGSGRTVTAGGANRARDHDDKDETASVGSSTFSLGEPVGEEPVVAKSAALAEKVESLNISNDSTPAPSVAAQGDKQTALPLEACLFCPYVSLSLTLNVSHMSKAHGLFIPEATYLVDLPGLIKYLGEKLVFGNMCLYCNKQKGGLEGIRTHMQHKGHTMLAFETEEQQVELGQFYDFRSTYSDAGEESSSSDEAEASRSKAADGEEDEWEDEDDNGEAWETDSDTSVDSTNLGSIPIDRVPRTSRRTESVGHHMQDGWHSHAHQIYHDEYELHLPSGRSVGHRSLARYYRQNLRDHPAAPARRAVEYRRADEEEEDDDDEEGGVEVGENRERALNRRERREEARAVARRGETGMIGATTSQKRDVQKMHKLAQAEEQRGRRRFEAGVNQQANSQKHFRDPLLQ